MSCDIHNRPLVPSLVGGKDYCPECAEEQIRREDEEDMAAFLKAQEDAKVRKWEERYKCLDFGGRFLTATFDNFEPVNERAKYNKNFCIRFAETFLERRMMGDSLLFLGKPGTGKNHLAAAIAKSAIDQGFKTVHTTAMKMVRAVKSTWGGKGDENEVVKSFTDPDLLIIDEVGNGFNNLADQVYIFETINERYADRKPTILISNCTEEQLCELLGAQVVDRFFEGNSKALVFDWESYRRRGALPAPKGEGE